MSRSGSPPSFSPSAASFDPRRSASRRRNSRAEPASTRPRTARCWAPSWRRLARKQPLSREILGPVLSFYRTPDAEAGFRKCREILEFGGEGHTARPPLRVRRDNQRILGAPRGPHRHQYADAFRRHGLQLRDRSLLHAGTGTWSGSIVSDNVTPLHLINIKRVAHEARPWRSIYSPNMGL